MARFEQKANVKTPLIYEAQSGLKNKWVVYFWMFTATTAAVTFVYVSALQINFVVLVKFS